MKSISGRGGNNDYLASTPEIVTILRYLLLAKREEYFVLHTDNVEHPKFTGGIVYEGIKPCALATRANLSEASQSRMTVTQGSNSLGIEAGTIRYVQIGNIHYWNLDNPWVIERRKNFPHGSDLIDGFVERIMSEYYPDCWKAGELVQAKRPARRSARKSTRK